MWPFGEAELLPAVRAEESHGVGESAMDGRMCNASIGPGECKKAQSVSKKHDADALIKRGEWGAVEEINEANSEQDAGCEVKNPGPKC